MGAWGSWGWAATAVGWRWGGLGTPLLGLSGNLGVVACYCYSIRTIWAAFIYGETETDPLVTNVRPFPRPAPSSTDRPKLWVDPQAPLEKRGLLCASLPPWNQKLCPYQLAAVLVPAPSWVARTLMRGREGNSPDRLLTPPNKQNHSPPLPSKSGLPTCN